MGTGCLFQFTYCDENTDHLAPLLSYAYLGTSCSASVGKHRYKMIDCGVVGCLKRQGEEYACTKRLFEERLCLCISDENRKYIVIKKTLDHTSVVCSKHFCSLSPFNVYCQLCIFLFNQMTIVRC